MNKQLNLRIQKLEDKCEFIPIEISLSHRNFYYNLHKNINYMSVNLSKSENKSFYSLRIDIVINGINVFNHSPIGFRTQDGIDLVNDEQYGRTYFESQDRKVLKFVRFNKIILSRSDNITIKNSLNEIKPIIINFLNMNCDLNSREITVEFDYEKNTEIWNL